MIKGMLFFIFFRGYGTNGSCDFETWNCHLKWGELHSAAGNVFKPSPWCSLCTDGLYCHPFVLAPVSVLLEELSVGNFFIFCVKKKKPLCGGHLAPGLKHLGCTLPYGALTLLRNLKSYQMCHPVKFALHVTKRKMVCFNSGEKWMFLAQEPSLATSLSYFSVLSSVWERTVYEYAANNCCVLVSLGEAGKGLPWGEERKASENLGIFEFRLLWAPETRQWTKPWVCS